MTYLSDINFFDFILGLSSSIMVAISFRKGINCFSDGRNNYFCPAPQCRRIQGGVMFACYLCLVSRAHPCKFQLSAAIQTKTLINRFALAQHLYLFS